jgi:hypothetical protein
MVRQRITYWQSDCRLQSILFLILTLLLLLLLKGPAAGALPKNVIILIGDGMGFEQVKAAGMYKNGACRAGLYRFF